MGGDWYDTWRVEEAAKAEKAWKKYKDRKPVKKEKHTSGSTVITFDDGTRENENEIVKKTTVFTFDRDGLSHVRHSNQKAQKFLVVNGPLVGQRVTEEAAGEEYRVYNCARFNRGESDPRAPRCVLVHVTSI